MKGDVFVAGSRLEVGKRLGKGGEGEVFALTSRSDLALKIYKASIAASRETKVQAMVGRGFAQATQLVAFPSDIARDSRGRFVGFVMRLVRDCRPLHDLYSPKSRREHFAKADYRFLVRASTNLARAIAQIHAVDCVVGDLNHSGILVAPDATVCLIDADSFQFDVNGITFPCVVGVPEFTAPELQGLNLGNVPRSKQHDLFALAVALFQILAMGKHPYAGRFSGPDKSLGEAIAEHRFAFSLARRGETGMSPPPAAIELGELALPIAAAFENAFGRDPSKRPSAADWVRALTQLESSLSHCTTVATHYYPSQAGRCSWCRIQAQSGVDMFPESWESGRKRSGGSFDLQRISSVVERFKFPPLQTLLPAWNGPTPAPTQAATKALADRSTKQMVGAAIVAASVLAGFALPALLVLWIATGVGGLAILLNANIGASPLLDAHRQAEQSLQSAAVAYLKRLGLEELEKVRVSANAELQEYKALSGSLSTELQRLRSTREQRQRDAYLDRFPIRSADISGIGPAKKATLISFGIETAADVARHKVLVVPGFGDALTEKLVQWRRRHEQGFRFNPNASDVQAEQALRSKFDVRKRDLETKLSSAAQTLDEALPRLRAKAKQADPAVARAQAALDQAEADLRAIGSTPPTRSALMLDAIVQSAPPRATHYASPPPRGQSYPAANRQGSPGLRCPQCGSSMVRRTARRGRGAGRQFWGCSRFPSCRGTRN